MDMGIKSAKNSKAMKAVSELLRKVNIAIRVINVIVQIITMVFYGIMLALNWGNAPRVVAYTICAIVSITMFITGFVLAKKDADTKEITVAKKKKHRRIKKIAKYVNYLARAILVSVAIYDIASGLNTSTTMVASTTFSTVSLVVNITFEIFAFILVTYIRLFKQEVQMKKEERAAKKASSNPKVLTDPRETQKPLTPTVHEVATPVPSITEEGRIEEGTSVSSEIEETDVSLAEEPLPADYPKDEKPTQKSDGLLEKPAKPAPVKGGLKDTVSSVWGTVTKRIKKK